MHPVHLWQAAADALFTIIGVMLHFTGDRSRMAFEFMVKKSDVCCLTFYVASASASFSVSKVSHLANYFV